MWYLKTVYFGRISPWHLSREPSTPGLANLKVPPTESGTNSASGRDYKMVTCVVLARSVSFSRVTRHVRSSEYDGARLWDMILTRGMEVIYMRMTRGQCEV